MGKQTFAIGDLKPGEGVEIKFRRVEMVPNPEWKLWKFWKPLLVEKPPAVRRTPPQQQIKRKYRGKI